MTAGRRSSAACSLAAVAGAAIAVLAVLGGFAPAAVAVLVAGGLLVPVRVPWGGTLPVGNAPVIAAVALLSPASAALALAVALLAGSIFLRFLRTGPAAVAGIQRYAGSIAGALALKLLVDVVVDGEAPMLMGAIAASVGLLAGDLGVSRILMTDADEIDTRSALPVHLTLACAGILVAVAVDGVGVAMAGVAAFPLLITRFAFERYAGATQTLDQTVQALGIVPELAGLAPLGHSERSARYAIALARQLGLDRPTTTRIVTATRLHHLGAVPFDVDGEHAPPLDPGQIAEHGARILRDAGLSREVADLLVAAKADSLEAVAPSLEAAVVRVAASFDDLVGEDESAADRGLALVSGSARDPHSRRVAGALLELAATDDRLVADAVTAGGRFREAAVGLDLEAVTSGRTRAGELVPFIRRG